MNPVEHILDHLLIIAIFSWLAWLLSSAWRRREKAKLQNRLMDSFSSTSDLVAFLETTGGRAFMGQLSEEVGSSAQTVVASVRTGIVLFAGGAGAMTVSARIPEHWMPGFALGTVLMFLGAGFLVSGAVTWWLSRRLGRTDNR